MSVTTYLPEGLATAGTGQLWGAPALANPAAPTLTELTAADTFQLGCNTYNWNPTKEQATQEEARYCLGEPVQILGRVTNNIEPLTIVYDPQDPESTTYQAYLKLVEGTVWYIVDRRGKPANTPLAAGDVVDIYKVRVGTRSRLPITNEAGETHRTQVPLAIIEPPRYDVKIVGPAPVAWAASTAYTVGQAVTLTGGEVLDATVAGTSGATEPTAPATVGGTVVDGSVTWTRRS